MDFSFVSRRNPMQVSGITISGSYEMSRIYAGSSHNSNKNSKAAEQAAVRYEHVEVNFELSVYTAKGRPDQLKESKQPDKIEQVDHGQVAQLRAKIHNEILEQVKTSLGTFFKENPEAAEEVSRGEIPEYFNVENTGRRILMIYFNNFQEGDDKSSFVSRAKEIINQAYSDVEGITGGLPNIVQETREFIMEMLDRFEKGEDISGFLGMNQLN